MGDCYYHGPYGGHNCSECDEERNSGMKQGTITVDRDTYQAKVQGAAIRQNVPLGLDPDGKPIKK